MENTATISDVAKATAANTTPPETPIQKDFCAAWPDAKIGLNLLEGILKNPFEKFALNILIEVGNEIQKNICPANTNAETEG